MLKVGRYLILVLILVFAISCSSKVNPKVKYKGSYSSYKKVLKQWTRSKNVYENMLDTIFVVTATYESKEFRKVYNLEKIRAEALPESDAAHLVNKSNEQLKTQAVFFVAFYTEKLRWNKLDAGHSAWKLWLLDEKGNQVAPVKVDRIKKMNFATTKYFPYWENFSYYYKVTFPRTTDEGKPLKLEKGTVKLLVAGINGKAELVWDIP